MTLMRENPNRMVNCQHAHAVFVWVGYRFMLPSVCESMVTAVAVWVELAAQPQSGTSMERADSRDPCSQTGRIYGVWGKGDIKVF